MLKLAAVKEGDVVWDLGCGDGRIVITAVKDFKAKEGYGVDIDPDRIKESQENAKKAGVSEKVSLNRPTCSRSTTSRRQASSRFNRTAG